MQRTRRRLVKLHNLAKREKVMFSKPQAAGPRWEAVYTCRDNGGPRRCRIWFSGPRTLAQAQAKLLWLAQSGDYITDIVVESLQRDGCGWYRGRKAGQASGAKARK